MTTADPLPAPGADAARRRIGYSASITINALILGAIVGWPGWEAVPFLIDDFRRVTGWIVAALAVAILVNAVYVVAGPPLVRALGELVSDAVSLAALIRLWEVFPFTFTDTTLPWATIVRVMIAVSAVALVIAMVVAAVRVLRGLLGGAAGGGSAGA